MSSEDKYAMLLRCIRFWESMLKDKGMLSISTQVLVAETIKYLKELEANHE